MAGAPLLLASASPRRLQLLAQVGIVPDGVLATDIDETPLKAELPSAYVKRIAAGKADAARLQNKTHIILSADTTVAVGRRIIGKSETPEDTRAFLKLMSGRRHRVITAVCALSPDGKKREKSVTSVVKFKKLTPQEIDAYIATDEWRGKAGAYGIQGHAAGFVTFISGSYPSIVGLPLPETLNMLESLGYERA